MATEMQKRVAKAVLENVGKRRPKSKGAILKEAGYSAPIVKNPQAIFESKGLKEALAEFGLTDKLIVSSLVSDIKKKPGKRYNELNLGAEILGLKKPDKSGGDTTNNIFIFDEQQRDRIARRIIARRGGSEGAPN